MENSALWFNTLMKFEWVNLLKNIFIIISVVFIFCGMATGKMGEKSIFLSYLLRFSNYFLNI